MKKMDVKENIVKILKESGKITPKELVRVAFVLGVKPKLKHREVGRFLGEVNCNEVERTTHYRELERKNEVKIIESPNKATIKVWKLK